MSDSRAASSTTPAYPSVLSLLGRLLYTQIVLGGVILVGAMAGWAIGVFPSWHKNGDTHDLLGWPYIADGVWSVVADFVIVLTLVVIGTWIFIQGLRQRGFTSEPLLAFFALLLAPAGLPLLWDGESIWFIAVFAVSLSLLIIATRVRIRRLPSLRQYSRALIAVWGVVLAFSVTYGLLHPLDAGGIGGGGPYADRPDGEQWKLPTYGLAAAPLLVRNASRFDVTLLGVEAPVERERFKEAVLGHWQPSVYPKDVDWGPEGMPDDLKRIPIKDLVIPSRSTRAITVVFHAARCENLDDLPVVRYVRLRYRLGPLTLTQPFMLSDPLALCKKTRAK